MPNPNDASFMARAIELSKLGYPAPNPHVGCVLVKGDRIVGQGFHDHVGGPHAEAAALEMAGGDARGSTAYVTLEPCNHQGRTAPCSLALIAAGVTRVVYAVPDPNPKATGGAQRLRDAGIAVEAGLMAQEAEEANLAWLTAVRRKRPYVVGKVAISLDGRIALGNGSSKWLTGEASRRQAHILRAECSAVMAGRRTVDQDDPELTVRHIHVVNQPLRIILDPQGSLPPDRKVFADPNYVRLVERSTRENDRELSLESGSFPPEKVLEHLFASGVTNLLIEGGAITLSSFIKARLVDRLELFIAPKLLGNGPAWFLDDGLDAVPPKAQWNVVRFERLGDDLWATAFPL